MGRALTSSRMPIDEQWLAAMSDVRAAAVLTRRLLPCSGRMGRLVAGLGLAVAVSGCAPHRDAPAPDAQPSPCRGDLRHSGARR